MILNKGLTFLILACFLCSSNGHKRMKRTFSSLFQSSAPEKNFPIYKVHRYTGIYIQPLHPHDQGSHHQDHGVPQLTGEPPSFVELPENNYDEDDDSSTGSGLGSLTSLLPLGSGLLTSALGSSSGSSSNPQNFNDRIGFASKKNLIKSIPSKKKQLVASAVSGVFNSLVNKGLAAKGLVKGAFKGPKTSIVANGVYKLVPLDYPRQHSFWSKVPIIRHFVKGTEIPLTIPDVYLPHLPQLVAIDAPPDLPVINIPGHYEFPYKTGAYVKIKIPNKKYEIPSTSYGVPIDPVPVPETPFQPSIFPSLEEPDEPTTIEPDLPTPEITTKPSLPYPAPKPEVSPHPEYVTPSQEYIPPPPETYPYPPETYPYPPEHTSPQEYVPPRPQYVTPQQEYIPPPPTPPEEPTSNFNVLPYPSASKPYVPSFPYAPETYPYPGSGYYQHAAASEQHEIQAEPEHPVYRHKEEPQTEEDDENEYLKQEEPRIEIREGNDAHTTETSQEE